MITCKKSNISSQDEILPRLADPELKLSPWNSTANKYYSSAGHHEQKNKKITGQIKFSAVKIRQQIKLVLHHSLCK